MRKVNTLLSVTILILMLIHIIGGMFQLAGVIPGGSRVLSKIAYLAAVLIALHAAIGIKLTIDTLKAFRKNRAASPDGAGIYFRENRLFWIRRISGFAMILFLFLHVVLFRGKNDGVYRLTYFGTAELAGQILLVLTIMVHLLSNLRPLMISCGSDSLREYLADAMFILSVILLLSGAALAVYFIRWNLII